MQKLDAQLAEDRVMAEDSLQKRLAERNRRRRELADRRKQLKAEEERLRSLVNDKLYESGREQTNANKEYDREKRKARERVLGNAAKELYNNLRNNIRSSPEREQQLKDEYER